MRVAVEGDGHAGVAQHLGHDLGVHAGDEHQCGGRVAQVMEADGRQSFAAQQRSQAALGDARAGQWIAELIGEDQAVIGPGRPRLQSRLGLQSALALESLLRRRGQGDS
ncbi:MAG TPA: hypothetical protein VHQ42_00730, partial [Candidatus Limnocylindria bacterium]|nr:hypothetical protein [Candidatus Limnocylindria bacterium]